MPLQAQVRLLRVLETGRSAASARPRCSRSDARVVAATNKDLGAEVAAGRFREDLYYRLSDGPAPHAAAPRARRRHRAALRDVPRALRAAVRRPVPPPRARRAALLRAVRVAGQRPRAAQRGRADGRPGPPGPRHRRGAAAVPARRLRLARPDARPDRAAGGRPGARARARSTARSSSCAPRVREIGTLLQPSAARRPSAPPPRRRDVRAGRRGRAGRARSPSSVTTRCCRARARGGLRAARPPRRLRRRRHAVRDRDAPTRRDARSTTSLAAGLPLPTMEDAETALIREALRRFDGNRRQTADALGISERTLYRKIKDIEIEEHRGRGMTRGPPSWAAAGGDPRCRVRRLQLLRAPRFPTTSGRSRCRSSRTARPAGRPASTSS